MQRLPREKFSYSIGQIVFGLNDLCFSYFFLYFYTSVLLVPAHIVGLALLVSLVFDAISDPIIGSLSDRVRMKKWGSRRQLMLIALLPSSVGLMLTFNPVSQLTELGLIVWMFGTAVFTRTAISLFYIPYMALGVDMSSDYVERSEISGLRFLASYSFGVIIAALFIGVLLADSVKYPDGKLNPNAYNSIGWIAGCLSLSLGALCIASTKDYQSGVTPLQPKTYPGYLKRQTRTLLTSKNLRKILILYVLTSIASGVLASLFVYIYSNFWMLSQEKIGFLSLSLLLVIYPSFVFSKYMTDKFDKKVGLHISILLLSSSFSLPIFFHYFDLFPALNSPLVLTVIFLSCGLVQLFSMAITILLFSIAADVTDEVQDLTSQDQKALTLSLISFCKKTSLGLGVFTASLILQFTSSHIEVIGANGNSTTSHDVAFYTATLVILLSIIFVLVLGRFYLPRHKIEAIQIRLGENSEPAEMQLGRLAK